MDVVSHIQRIADRTGDKLLHETARKAHSACAKGLPEAPGGMHICNMCVRIRTCVRVRACVGRERERERGKRRERERGARGERERVCASACVYVRVRACSLLTYVHT